MRKNAQIDCFEGKLTVKLEIGTYTEIPTSYDGINGKLRF